MQRKHKYSSFFLAQLEFIVIVICHSQSVGGNKV